MFQEQKASLDEKRNKHEKPTQTEKKNLFALFFRVNPLPSATLKNR